MNTVLLVDDDRDFRTLVAAVLRASGIEVVETESATVAERTLSQLAVDLVVVDGLLCDGEGVALIEQLRTRNREVRVVFVSAFLRDLKTFLRLTNELDVSLVVYKPVAAEGLAEKILPLLRKHGDGEQGAGPRELAAELEALRKQFAAKLPDKLQQLELAVARAQVDGSKVIVARGLAHRLRGSAGSYGYPALGEAAGRLEDLLAQFQGGPAPARRYFWEEVANAMEDARACLARAPEPDLRGLDVAASWHKALLVVDDDPDILQLASSVGRKLLFQVVTAQTALEAVQRARATPLLAAVLSLHLQGGSAFSLARAIRNTGENGEIPIAFASVDHSIETRVAAIEAGAAKFFEKPMSEESFASLAQQLANLSAGTEGRVLIADDDPEVVRHYALHLRTAGIKVDTQESADGIVELLEQLRPDVLLLDVDLPRVSGIDVCRALRMSNRFELLPILMVTGRTDYQTRLRAFRAGASDVVAKPVIPEKLLARVGVQLERMRLLRERADKDSLSGLLLRRAFIEAFQRALASSARDRKPLSLVLLDIDFFKRINDEHGHLAGDLVIARLGDLLRRRFRVEDIRGRWGGEEFVLAFPGQNAEFAQRAAGRLLADFSQVRFASEGGEPFGATFTAGVAAYPEDGTSISALLRRADELLYVGKRQGRNQVWSVGARCRSDESNRWENGS
jgi:diguanylate cyclase (GGDEF)-like protein